MRGQIALGEVRLSRIDLPDKLPAGDLRALHGQPRADAAAVALRPGALDLEPVAGRRGDVHAEIGALVKVGDDEVQVAVAVDVGPGGAATDLADDEGRAGRFPERDELAVHLLEHEVVLLVSRKASLVVLVEVKVLPEMPIGDEQIQIAVVVGIEEAGPPRQVFEGGLSGAQGPRHFGEPKSSQIPVEIVHLRLVIGLHEVEPSIVIVVPPGHSHPRLFHPVLREGHAASGGRLAELSPTEVLVEQARGPVARDIQVLVSIVVDVGEGHSQRAAQRRGDSARFRDVLEGPVSAVAVEDVADGVVMAGRAVLADPLSRRLQPPVAGNVVLASMVHVVRDIEVNEAVAVHVGEGAGGIRCDDPRHARLFRDVREGEIAVVPVEHVGPVEARHVEIDVAVIVDVRPAHAELVARIPKPRPARGVDEVPRPVVDVEDAVRRGIGSLSDDGRLVQQVEISVPVAIRVEEDRAGAEDLHEELLLAAAIELDEIDAAGPRLLDEPDAGGCGRNRRLGGSRQGGMMPAVLPLLDPAASRQQRREQAKRRDQRKAPVHPVRRSQWISCRARELFDLCVVQSSFERSVYGDPPKATTSVSVARGRTPPQRRCPASSSPLISPTR